MAHVLLVILAYTLWLVIGIGFPLYALVRSAVQGYQSGLLVRLPAKVLAILWLGYASSSAVNASLQRSFNTCFRMEYSAYRFYTFVLPTFVVAMLIARVALLEPRLARMVKRENWNSRVRLVDGIAGAILDMIAMVFVLDILLLSFGFTDSPVTNYPADFLSSGNLRGVVFIDNLPSVFDGVLQLEQKLHVGQSAYSLLQQQCPVNGFGEGTYIGIYLWTALLALLLLAPIMFILAFQSLTYLKTNGPRWVGPDACADCHGVGTYGLDKPLLLAGLCERCIGTGRSVRDGQRMPSFSESWQIMGGSLMARGYGVFILVYTVVPVLVYITRFRR